MIHKRQFLIGLIACTAVMCPPSPVALCREHFSSSAPQNKFTQQKPPLTLNQIEALIKIPTPDRAIVIEIRRRGIAFDLDTPTSGKLRKLGAGPKTLSALAEVSTKKHTESQSEAPLRKTIVLVTNFKSLEDEDYAVTETIIDQLRDATKGYGDIQIQGLGESITAQQGSEAARQKGREHKADIVLWGWLSKTKEKAIISVHFEVLQKPEGLILHNEKQTLILALGELESFNIQVRLSSEMTYLTLLTIGLARLEVDDYDSAISQFSIALAQIAVPVPGDFVDPDDIYFYRGLAYFSKSLFLSEDRFDNASADLDKAIQLNPNKMKARSLRGGIYFARHETDKAIEECDQIIAFEPKNPFPYFLRGLAYSTKGNRARADDDFNKFSQLGECDCPDGDRYYIRAVVALAREDFDQVIVNIDQAIAHNDKVKESDTIQAPFLAALFFMRGCGYAGKGNYDQAQADFDRALSLNPKFAWAYCVRGRIYREKEDYDRAIVESNKAISLNPSFAEAYELRGDAYRYKGDYDKAIADLSRAVELNPNSQQAYGERGDAYRYKADYDKAIADYSQVVKLNPKNALSYYYLGIVYRRKGEMDQAITNLNQYIVLEPTDTDGYSIRAYVHELKGDLDKAISDYDEIIRLKPDSSYAYYDRGLVYLGRGNLDQAIADLSESIKFKSDYASAYLQRGIAYAGQGSQGKSQAIADLKMALALASDPETRKQAEEKLQQLGVK